MGLFDKVFAKKVCDICGGDIGLLGNRKLEDGNLCKDCAKRLSPWTTDRRTSTVEQIRAHLQYRDDNFRLLPTIHPDLVMGNNTKIYVDQDAGKFFVTAYTDTGVWSVYFGCDAEDLKRCLRLVHRELRRLIDRPLSPRALNAAKQQLLGQLGISYDHFENVALAMGKRYLHYHRVLTPVEIAQSIEALTPEDLQSIATEIFNPDRLTTLIYQPE